jgi:hypothetical protein
MNTMRTKVSTIVAITSLLVGGLAATAQAQSSYSTDFENFALGGDTSGSNPLISDPALTSNNWRGNGSSGLADNGVPGSLYDGEIVDTGTPYGQAYRLSNAKVSGNYDQTHAATPTVGLVGESSTSATLDTFKFSFDFKAAVNALQDGLNIDVTPFESNSANRQGILKITDDPTDGFSVGWLEFQSGGVFNLATIATGLARDAWHSLDVTMVFADGADNDSVTIDLNGSPTAGLQTWENAGFYSSAVAVDSLIYRVSNPFDSQANTGGVAALDDGGVFFDNVSVAAVPEPASLSLLAIGGLALLRRRF